MSKETVTRYEALGKPLFIAERNCHDLALGYHNVADVLPGSGRTIQNSVTAYYSQRGWHIPRPSADQLPHTRTGLLMAERTGDVAEQIAYLNSMSDLRLEAVTPGEIPQGKTLIVPYINTKRASERLTELGVEIVGMPPGITNALKNKADSHLLLKERYQSPVFNVPDFEISEIANLTQEGAKFFKKIEQIYENAHLFEAYEEKGKVGIVLRPAESDGAYGNCRILRENGEFVVKIDGKKSLTATDLQDAFAIAQNYFATSMDQEVEKRIVMSRLLDVEESPGMTVSIIEGHVLSWGWNSQIQDPVDDACIGSSSYIPKNDYCRGIQAEFEEKMAEEYEAFLTWFARRSNIDFSTIRANTNVDIMIPTLLEFELQHRRGQERHLPLAEFNPRLSEFSDSVIGRTLFDPLEQTVRACRGVIQEGISTFAKYELPGNIDPRDVRTELHAMYQARQQKELVVVRMAPTPPEDPTAKDRLHPTMGLVIYGDRVAGEMAIQNAIYQAQGRQRKK